MIVGTANTPPLKWQEDKRLKDDHKVWLITDAKTYTSGMYGCSKEQRFYRVGGLDLATNCLGYFKFSTDDVRAMLKSGIDPAPWKSARQFGVGLTRHCHGSQKEGRFRESVCLIELDPALLTQGPALRAYFEERLSFHGNVDPGMWSEMVAWAARENRIETAALLMVGWFAAGDLKKVVGLDENVTTTLSRLVREGLLTPNGEKRRLARYMVAPPKIVERVDWVE